MPPGLERLEMRHCDRYGLVEALVKAASTSITQLRLGEAGFPPTDLINALIPAAPRLVEVELISESTHSSDYMRPFLQKLARVRILQISVYGYDPSKLFAMLEQLPTLESFTLKLSPFFLDRSVSRLPVIKAANAISFIRQARLLKSLTLPVELRKIWSLNAELAGVEQAAFFGNVKLSFKRGEGTS
ncbi:hypothetical protein BCR35DRAFT_81201 [Leucosporidium creatinivorum]|uniref:F-box domain-containing protein n=1 Tax=Leucosporidium creatinivorum TaxID=106004 RepID=A0A1Y2FHN9_9BASI|nr:hypothetical protein BCR35DRAFT_81201 [Leucosporidium creatinivorum]